MKAFSSQKTMIASGVGIGLTAVLTVASFLPRGVHGEFDLNALNQQVQDQQAAINNHEARIKNNENDIKKLQDNTNTQPADHVTVPTATSTAPTTTAQPAQAAPAPAPVVVPVYVLKNVYEPDTCENGMSYSHYTTYYSDGTSKHFDVAAGGGTTCWTSTTPINLN